MSYSLDDAIEDRVVPAFKAFLELKPENRTTDALTRCITDATGVEGTDYNKPDEMCALFIEAMFTDDMRLGLKLREIAWWLTYNNLRLVELHMEDNGDLIVEKFDAVKEDE